MAALTFSAPTKLQWTKRRGQASNGIRAAFKTIKQGSSRVSLKFLASARWLQGEIVILCLWVQRQFLAWWLGAPDEQPKKILPKPSVARIIRKIIVHFPPIAAATVALSINYYGAFVGNELVGYNSGSWQDFYKLCLQVVAKIHELCIVASLATIIMDVVRYHLLAGPDGLPLGLLTAKTQFIDVLYLLSPDFRHGMLGIIGYKRFTVGLLILTSSAISLLAGPASALLLIPKTYNEEWGAGGAQFQLLGTKETLWPSQLDALSIGGEHCQVPDDRSNFTLQQYPKTTSCVWVGYESLAQFWRSSQLNKHLAWISMQDSMTRKMVNVLYRNNSGAAISPPLAPCRYSDLLEGIWRSAAYHAPSAQPGRVSKAQNFKYRRRNGTRVTIESEIPVVWTTCLANVSVSYANLSDQTYFPLQFEYPEYRALMLPSNDSQLYGKQYSFDTPMYANSSKIAAIWLETPEEERIGTRVDENGISGRSSAYLNVQIPFTNGSGTSGYHAACSIDARWYQSAIQGTGAAQSLTDTVYSPPSIVTPRRNGRWRQVRLRSSWLHTLTPPLRNSSEGHWNTLSSILTDAGISNSTGLLESWDLADEYISAVVSTVVADGMSRIGFEKNGGDGSHYMPWLDENIFKPEYSDQELDQLLAGNFKLPPPAGVQNGTSQGYPLQWKVAISGLGYRADGTTYYIASAILLTHAAIALAHIVWVMKTRQTSTAWNSLNHLVILALKSSPPGLTLENTSAGVMRYPTYQEHMRIQAVTGPAITGATSTRPDRVEMMLDADALRVQHDKVESETPYK